MQAHAVTDDTRELFQTMHKQHVRIDALLKDLQDHITGDDREAMRLGWGRLEDAVLTHLNVEEMHFLPAITSKDPTHARQVRIEHEEIRARLGQLGLEFELHTVRAEAIDDLASQLRKHARFEEMGLYPLAEEVLDRAHHRSILARVRHAFARFAPH